MNKKITKILLFLIKKSFSVLGLFFNKFPFWLKCKIANLVLLFKFINDKNKIGFLFFGASESFIKSLFFKSKYSCFVEKKYFNPDYRIILDITKKTQRILCLNNNYERSIVAFLRDNLKSDDVFIDVGANVGFYSLLASKILTNGVVLSFEPEKYNYGRLLKNILINNTKNVKCFNLSIGNENKDYYLNINPLNDGGHSINTFEYYSDNNDSFSVDYICSLYGDEISQKTRIEKLDNFMKFLPKKFNKLIIKIDVEGYEKECIEGMRNIINTYKNLILIVEVSERNLNLIKSLENMSFDACMFTDKEISKIDRVNIRPGNYLFRKQ